MEYSFEHGIDHCGQAGISPILCIGGPVMEQDFNERDLSAMRGVSISQRGLPEGTRWDALNLRYLFERLPGIEYLRVWYEDAISLNTLGALPTLRYLEIDAPRVRQPIQGSMPALQRAHVRWTDACTAQFDAPLLKELVLIRPRSQSMAVVSHLTALQQLDVHGAYALQSLDGIQPLKCLRYLGLHDCPKLTSLYLEGTTASPQELVIGGCNGFVDASDIHRFTSLRKLSIYRGQRGSRTVKLPRHALPQGFELELHGAEAECKDAV